jgi:hypothetical protein
MIAPSLPACKGCDHPRQLRLEAIEVIGQVCFGLIVRKCMGFERFSPRVDGPRTILTAVGSRSRLSNLREQLTSQRRRERESRQAFSG